MGGYLTQTQYCQESSTKAARSKRKGKRLVAKKSPKSGIVPGEEEPRKVNDPNKIVYDPIPKYHGTSASDLCRSAVGLTNLSEWRNNFDYNRHDYAPSQLSFKTAYEELKKELKIPIRQEQEKTIAQHKDPAAKAKWRKHFAKKEQTVYEEACMHNVGGVASVCWIPADPNHPSKKDPVTGKLHGKY